jgi:molecular chaperone DnaJ
MPKNYYLILGVGSNATPGEIKAAFRQRAKELHPDRSGIESGPFLEVQEAYGVLSDAAQRRRYDRLFYERTRASREWAGVEPLIPKLSQRESLHPFQQKEDIIDVSLTKSFERYRPSFEQLFERLRSNFEPISRPKAERLESLMVEVPLTTWQARRGGRIRVWMPARTTCCFCGGHDGIAGYECSRCAGQGSLFREFPVEIDYPPMIKDFVTRIPLAGLGIHNFYLTVGFRIQ